jgi:hypothetical protein
VPTVVILACAVTPIAPSNGHLFRASATSPLSAGPPHSRGEEVTSCGWRRYSWFFMAVDDDVLVMLAISALPPIF